MLLRCPAGMREGESESGVSEGERGSGWWVVGEASDTLLSSACLPACPPSLAARCPLPAKHWGTEVELFFPLFFPSFLCFSLSPQSQTHACESRSSFWYGMGRARARVKWRGARARGTRRSCLPRLHSSMVSIHEATHTA